jgi:ABC-type transport system substrate-binding protein
LSNVTRFRHPDYDRLYERARGVPVGAERDALMHSMSEVANAYAPWVLGPFTYENTLVHPWLLGYKYNGFHPHAWPYFDIDTEKRTAAMRQ